MSHDCPFSTWAATISATILRNPLQSWRSSEGQISSLSGFLFQRPGFTGPEVVIFQSPVGIRQLRQMMVFSMEKPEISETVYIWMVFIERSLKMAWKARRNCIYLGWELGGPKILPWKHLQEMDLNWSLMLNGLRPRITSRDASLTIYCKKVQIKSHEFLGLSRLSH